MGTSSHISRRLRSEFVDPQLYVGGQGKIAGLLAELTEQKQIAKQAQALNESLNERLDHKEHELDSAYQQLKAMMVESGTLQDALDRGLRARFKLHSSTACLPSPSQTFLCAAVDRVMASREGPIRLSANQTLGQMWKHMNFAVINKERNRHLEEYAAVVKAKADQKRQLEAEKCMLKKELSELEQEHAVALEIIGGLQLGNAAVKLCGEEQATVKSSLETATGPRPWLDPQDTVGGKDSGSAWTFEDWLEPLELHRLLAPSFELMLKDKSSPKGLQNADGRRAFLAALGQQGNPDTIRAMLRAAPLLDALTTKIWDAVRAFSEQCISLAEGKARAREIAANAKKVDENAEPDMNDPETFTASPALRKLTYGPPHLFHSTLRDSVGSPSIDGLAAMCREHTVQADSDVEFLAPNYEIRTTSKLEWYIVADPDKAKEELGLDDWVAGGGHTPVDLGFRHVNSPNGEHFAPKIAEVNHKLSKIGDKEKLKLEHFCALRMYTGPIYIKYNFILRGAWSFYSNAFIDNYIKTSCRGNKYPTTMLYMCLGIQKLSRITKAQKVYRAPGGILPKAFFKLEADGFRGGIELGLMSTTTNREEAMKYAAYSGAPVLFEVQQGMVARGADISWLSQFPAEAEVLFGPLTVCEVYRVRAEGAFQIIELRPSTSGAAKASEMELLADEKICGMLQMLRKDPSLLDSMEQAIISKGVQPDQLAASEPTIQRSREYRTSMAVMSQAATELAEAYAKEADRAELLADSNPDGSDLTPRAIADHATSRSRRFAGEVMRYMGLESDAVKDVQGVERLFQYSSPERRERKEKTKARWGKIQKEADDTRVSLSAISVMRKKRTDVRTGFP